MSARDIIRNVLLDERDIDGCLHLSDSILEALTSSGYRILAPGSLDRETLEAAAKHLEGLPSFGDGKWAAAAIRALGGKP